MSCIDLEKISVDILDINRTITIPIRTPYNLTLTTTQSCPSSSVSLYDEAKNNGYRMGGIILDETASMICKISSGIVCDTLKAYNITIQDSNCGISQGSYNSIYIDNSVLATSSIKADVVCCNKDTIINQSTFKIGSSIDILNGISIKESTVISNNFLVILTNATREETEITDSSIKVDNYSFLDNINATQSDFNLNTAISYDSKFKDCSLNLEFNTQFEPSGYLQPRLPEEQISFSNHINFITDDFLYQDSTCYAYTYNDEQLLVGCSDLSSAISAMQHKLSESMLERKDVLDNLQYIETKTNKFKQSSELLDSTTQMIQWVSGQPFSFSEEDHITIGQIFKKCIFDNTIINNSNALILNQCYIQNSSGIINASQILSREFDLSPTFQNSPTAIEQFSFDEESNTYSTYRTIAYIGNSSLDFEQPNYGTTAVFTDSHITTEKWLGEVIIGPGCSIKSNDFFAEYCYIHDYARLIIDSENIMFKNLGIQMMSKEATLEIPNGRLYITPNYNRDNSSSIYSNIIPDIQGTITGTSIGIYQPKNNGTSDIFKNTKIYCDSLSINASDMIFDTIASFKEIEITKGAIHIQNLDASENIIAKNCELTINNIASPKELNLQATHCLLTLDLKDDQDTIENAQLNNSELKAGSLLYPSLSGSIKNSGVIWDPIIKDHISYHGGDNSVLIGATFPNPSYVNGVKTESSFISFSYDKVMNQPPSIGGCIIPSGNSVLSPQKLVINNNSDDNSLSDIASMDANEIEITSGSTILSHGKIKKIFTWVPFNVPDSYNIGWIISLIKINNINNKGEPPLIISESIYYLKDFVIQNTKVDLDVDQHHFINLILESRSVLDGKSKGLSHCSFIFNVDNSQVKNLDLNLHYSMIAFSGVINNCVLNFEPLTSIDELNSYDSYREQLEQLNIPDYYYYMEQTSLKNCIISGTTGAHLRIYDCDFYNVALNTSQQFIYSFTNNHFNKYSFDTQQRGSVFPTESIVNLDKCYWNNINWSIDNTKITFTSMIDNTELVKPTIKILNNSRADFVSTDNVGFISGDLTSNIALHDCQNFAKIIGQINTSNFINSRDAEIYAESVYLSDSTINNGAIYVTGTSCSANSFVNNNLINITYSGNFIDTTNNANGNLIAISGTIVLENSVNNGNIDCDTLIIINSTNNGIINCNNLTWINSQNNTNDVSYQNDILVDDTLTYPNS